MRYLILLFPTFFLMGNIEQSPNPKHSFFYANSGIYYAGEDVQGIDLGIGYRHVYGYSGLDINVGGTLIEDGGFIPFPFIQGSYLLYPLKESGPYAGLGVSFVPFLMATNFPLIVGYQIPNESHPVFTQIQFSLVQMPGLTFSLGVGF